MPLLLHAPLQLPGSARCRCVRLLLAAALLLLALALLVLHLLALLVLALRRRIVLSLIAQLAHTFAPPLDKVAIALPFPEIHFEGGEPQL